MGLPADILRLIAKMHAKRPFMGPVLTLGVQDLYDTYDNVWQMLRRSGIAGREVPPEERQRANSIHMRQSKLEERGYLHARTFFRMLGIDDYRDLDVTPDEGAQLIHDLNQPVPQEWRGQHGLVFDGGTLEHVFDVKTALTNMVLLTRVGGEVLHLSPCANWINHGFHQPSPCLYYDFYGVNGFEVRDAMLISCEAREDGTFGVKYVQDYQHTLKTLGAIDPTPLLLLFRAHRAVEVPKICTPGQTKYIDRMAGPHFQLVRAPAAVAPAARGEAAARELAAE